VASPGRCFDWAGTAERGEGSGRGAGSSARRGRGHPVGALGRAGRRGVADHADPGRGRRDSAAVAPGSRSALPAHRSGRGRGHLPRPAGPLRRRRSRESENQDRYFDAEWSVSLAAVASWTEQTVLVADNEDSATALFALTPTQQGQMRIDPVLLPSRRSYTAFAYGYSGGHPGHHLQRPGPLRPRTRPRPQHAARCPRGQPAVASHHHCPRRATTAVADGAALAYSTAVGTRASCVDHGQDAALGAG
jgi:hypothetical protein